MLIKRYELAERWFTDAFEKKRDFVYRAWVGFTYIKLAESVTIDNPKRLKFLGYAVKNLTRCTKEADLALYALTALLFLSVKQAKVQQKFAGLEDPTYYLNALK